MFSVKEAHIDFATIPDRALPIVDGQELKVVSDTWFENNHPGSEQITVNYVECNRQDVDAAVSAARRSFDDGRWASLSPMTRKTILLDLADKIEAAADKIGLMDCVEMGRPISHAVSDARFLSAGILRYHAEGIDKLYGTVAPSCAASHVIQSWVPCGVVAAITPWNFPSVNAMVKIAPALAMGNSCVLKPSETASLSALCIAELALEAGVPEGVLNVLTGSGKSGQMLAEHPDVDMIAFTGSTETGRSLLASAGVGTLKRTLLECGGKSPQIVFADMEEMDIDLLAARLLADIMWNSGQVCVAKSRLIIQQSLHDKLKGRLVRALDDYKLADPLLLETQLGPLGLVSQQEKVNSIIADAVASGAEAVVSSTAFPSRGCYVPPTLLFDVAPESRAVREEIFGPVLTVQAFDTAEDAISMANLTETGLAASVWTKDVVIAHQLGNRIRAGDVTIHGTLQEVEGAGFAGIGEPMKSSGFGTETGIAGLQSYAIRKSVSFSFG